MKLFKNATFYTMEKEEETTNMVLTNNGIIMALGAECLKYNPKEIIDLKGNFVYPGFVDAHMHLIGLGRKLMANVLKSDDVINEVKNLYKNDDLYIEGYHDKLITKDDLDKISVSKKIILRHNDYHSFTVNSKVLSDAGLSHETGIIKDENTSKIMPFWNNHSKIKLTKMCEIAILKLYEYGITGVHSEDLGYFNSYEETLNILSDASKKYPFRINMLISYNIFDEYLKNYKIKNKYLKPIQVKLFYDGTISSKTALLSKNYKNDVSNGKREYKIEDFEEIIKKLRNKNQAVAVHAIGDLALSEVVEILEKHKNNTKYLDRIIHASLAHEKTIKKLSKNNIALDIQPLFIKSDEKIIKENINHDVLIFPFKKYIEENIIVNSSSDAPVEDINPLYSMYYLNLKPFEMIKAYTTNPALTINDNSGYIKKGMRADFSVFTKDLLKIKREELKENLVYATIIDEKQVYLKGEQNDFRND